MSYKKQLFLTDLYQLAYARGFTHILSELIYVPR